MHGANIKTLICVSYQGDSSNLYFILPEASITDWVIVRFLRITDYVRCRAKLTVV